MLEPWEKALFALLKVVIILFAWLIFDIFCNCNEDNYDEEEETQADNIELGSLN